VTIGNTNVCTQCINGYSFSSNYSTCIATITNCAVNYNGVCFQCNAGYYIKDSKCVAGKSNITNCITYSTDGNSCIKCATGYYINGNTCAVIPSTYANCATYSSNQCSLCNAGYMVNTLPTVGTCVLPLDYITAATNSPCAVLLTNTSTQTPTWIANPSISQFIISCGTCNNYMYGYAPLQSEAICVNSNQLTLYNGFTSVANCQRYGLNYATSPAVVCMQCASGYFLSGYTTLAEKTTATTCVNTCSADATFLASPAVVVDDMLGFVNICVPNNGGGIIVSAGNCARYGRALLHTIGQAGPYIADYICYQVISGTGTYPTTALLYELDKSTIGGAQYIYESPSASTQQPVSLAGTGFSNTVDSNSNFPNVFNYLGFLAGHHYTANALVAANLIRPYVTAAPTSDTAFSATSVSGNNINNCDIVAKYTAATYGATVDHHTSLAAAGSATFYGCFRCAFGYQISATGSTTSATINPTPSCVQMTTCASSNTVYGGLTQFLNSILSCHVCSTASGSALYPTIYYEYLKTNAGNGNGNWYGWAANGINTVAGNTVTVAAGNGFKCATAPSSLLNSQAGAAVTSVANCAVYGLGQVVTAMPPATPVNPAQASASISTGSNFCLACAANYWPSYISAYVAGATNGITGNNNLPNYAVTSCTASVNCDTSVITQFNGCGKCRSDLENLASPSYYAFMDLTFSNCYQAASRNCLILSTSSFSTTSTTNVCDTCKAGFFLNSDNVCESYRVPNQNVATGVFVNAYAASKAYTGTTATTYNNPATSTTDYKIVRLHYALSYKQLQYGVSGCSSGYSIAPANPWAPRLCVFSSYVYNNTGTFASSSNFINNCVRYNLTQVNSKNVCGGCNTGFVPTQDGTSCVTSSSVPNCFYAQNSPNTALCYQCPQLLLRPELPQHRPLLPVRFQLL